ncbi:LOW QUALITY PROTEIN: hypothetical protein PanWU01x14_019050 [Parasponia andersonii]|uniref:Uncharacterized protein n=1 Tax=Parasponia andersonii TaxID=3476 RepID=A0A2P5DZE8_PARAD|nr:LOW QUALITY PROTEIN: hypothetical protein PanWU01x14_019050 [Parasponia andersonii]
MTMVMIRQAKTTKLLGFDQNLGDQIVSDPELPPRSQGVQLRVEGDGGDPWRDLQAKDHTKQRYLFIFLGIKENHKLESEWKLGLYQ